MFICENDIMREDEAKCVECVKHVELKTSAHSALIEEMNMPLNF